MGFTRKLPLTEKEEIEQMEQDFRHHNLTTLPDIIKILFAAIEIIERNGIPYAMIGGIAVKELGRPRVTHDIDIFVRPDDAESILELLRDDGFSIEKRDPYWLYKAWKDEILVDIIFRSCGDIYFEEEVRDHVRRIPFHGKYINAISPEDFIVIKSAAHQEDNPHHWHDALAVLTQGSLDWEYLLKRARLSPRRVLSLLIYAQSNDIAIPTETIQKLYKVIFEHPLITGDPHHHPYKSATEKNGKHVPIDKDSDIYCKGRIIEALTSDERIAEHDIKVVVANGDVVIRGEVFSYAQKLAIDDVIKRIEPEKNIHNNVIVRILQPPESSEVIS